LALCDTPLPFLALSGDENNQTKHQKENPVIGCWDKQAIFHLEKNIAKVLAI
jgi:hypothetical protein